MHLNIQYIVVLIVGIIIAAFLIYKGLKFFKKKPHTSACNHCKGCALKNSITFVDDKCKAHQK